jgi:hypothetical protein
MGITVLNRKRGGNAAFFIYAVTGELRLLQNDDGRRRPGMFVAACYLFHGRE